MGAVSSLAQEKSAALSRKQRQQLSNIITSKKVLLGHATGSNIIRKKQDAWRKVAAEFNAIYVAEQPKTVTQLKRAWEYIRKL